MCLAPKLHYSVVPVKLAVSTLLNDKRRAYGIVFIRVAVAVIKHHEKKKSAGKERVSFAYTCRSQFITRVSQDMLTGQEPSLGAVPPTVSWALPINC